MSRSNAVSIAFAFALAALVGCSSDAKDALNIPVDQAVEAGLDDALDTTVVPVYSFFGAIGNLLASGTRAAVAGEFVCPDTSGWCASGRVSCSVTSTGLAFDFDECVLITGDAPLTIDGNIDAIPGNPILLTLTNLFVNDSPAMSGTGSINLFGCSYYADITTSKAHLFGLLTQCDSDPFPTGDTLFVVIDPFMVQIVLDGSSVAQAYATRDETPVANCTINLATDPLTSSCDAL